VATDIGEHEDIGRGIEYRSCDVTSRTQTDRVIGAWNTMKMQLVLDRWNTRRSTTVLPELIGRIAPTRTEGINLRGMFSFPIE
jgi:hypothetical protein